MFIEFLQVFLPIVIDILLIVLLVVGIIIGFRLINIMGKIDNFVDNLTRKVQALDGLFNVIDYISDGITNITDSVVDKVMGFFSKVAHKKNNKKNIESEEEV